MAARSALHGSSTLLLALLLPSVLVGGCRCGASSTGSSSASSSSPSGLGDEIMPGIAPESAEGTLSGAESSARPVPGADPAGPWPTFADPSIDGSLLLLEGARLRAGASFTGLSVREDSLIETYLVRDGARARTLEAALAAGEEAALEALLRALERDRRPDGPHYASAERDAAETYLRALEAPGPRLCARLRRKLGETGEANERARSFLWGALAECPDRESEALFLREEAPPRTLLCRAAAELHDVEDNPSAPTPALLRASSGLIAEAQREGRSHLRADTFLGLRCMLAILPTLGDPEGWRLMGEIRPLVEPIHDPSMDRSLALREQRVGHELRRACADGGGSAAALIEGCQPRAPERAAWGLCAERTRDPQLRDRCLRGWTRYDRRAAWRALNGLPAVRPTRSTRAAMPLLRSLEVSLRRHPSLEGLSEHLRELGALPDEAPVSADAVDAVELLAAADRALSMRADQALGSRAILESAAYVAGLDAWLRLEESDASPGRLRVEAHLPESAYRATLPASDREQKRQALVAFVNEVARAEGLPRRALWVERPRSQIALIGAPMSALRALVRRELVAPIRSPRDG